MGAGCPRCPELRFLPPTPRYLFSTLNDFSASRDIVLLCAQLAETLQAVGVQGGPCCPEATVMVTVLGGGDRNQLSYPPKLCLLERGESWGEGGCVKGGVPHGAPVPTGMKGGADPSRPTQPHILSPPGLPRR